jgi:hypothetical protein
MAYSFETSDKTRQDCDCGSFGYVGHVIGEKFGVRAYA